ncbi:MAG TPA: hypothetical protein VNZ93_08170 [Pseudorhodoplanes sp.]|nr:hypothetical protein [Pseudorhodoplanes sp.]
MRSGAAKGNPVQARRAWEAPAMTEVPIAAATKAAGAGAGTNSNPPAPTAPTSKLGFSFEMSFPLAVRTE